MVFIKKFIEVKKMGDDLTKNERRQLKLEEKRDAKARLRDQEVQKEIIK